MKIKLIKNILCFIGAFILNANIVFAQNVNSTPNLGSIASASTQSLGLHNRLINGNFSVNARQVSGTVTLGAGGFGLDHWKAGASGATYTFAASGVDTTVTISAGSLQQIVPAANVETTTYVLSWSGTAQCKGGGGSYGASPQYLTNATVGSNYTIECNTGTLTTAQLEPGTVQTTFERRPYALELALCQFFYRRITGSGAGSLQIVAYMTSGNYAPIILSFAPMYAAPTANILGTWTYSNVTGSVVLSATAGTVQLQVQATSTGLAIAQSPAGGGIELNADL